MSSCSPLIAQLTLPDYVLLVAYIAATVALGSFLGRGQSSLTDYFLADRKTHWILAAVSIIATDLSAISYMGMPAWMYEHDLKFLSGVVFTPLTFLLVIVLFLPVFYRLQVFTVYEYLERRFHPLARTLIAVLFLFQRGVWLAAAIYIPSIALASFMNVPILVCIIAIGLLTTLYTMIGGMKAVIWTDFLQFVVMMGGLVIMIGIQLAHFQWDVGAIWARAGNMTAPATGTPYTTWVDWSFDFRTEASIWSLLMFYIVYNLGTYGTDQVVVQRYFTMRTFREQVKAIMGSGLLTIVAVFLLACQGLLMVLYYRDHPELAASLPKADYIQPHFIVNVLPAGVRGLIFAAIFSATMSSVSAGLNSFATVGIIDLYKRHFRRASVGGEPHLFQVAKICTLVSGLVATAVAIWFSTFETTILQTLIALASKFIGPISGVFLLGVLTRRGNVAGVIVGAACGLAAGFLLDLPVIKANVSWLWTAPLASIVALVTGYLASLAIPVANRCSMPESPEAQPDETTVP